MQFRRFIYASQIVICLLAAPIAQARVVSSYQTGTWGSAQFTELWNGYGYTNWTNGLLTMSPEVATSPSETHSSFVLSTTRLTQPYHVHAHMTTTAQLRTGSSPNPWEVGWIAFGYTNGKFKYLILKPDGHGIELGESLGNNGQNFLWTSPFGQSSFPINQARDIDLIARNNVLTVNVNGATVLTYKISSKDMLGLAGKVGFYTEDATVQVSNISVTQY